MCGIFGYKWINSKAHQILFTWLKRLEYRGYDSAWIAVGNSQKAKFKIIKSIWKVSNLYNQIEKDIYPEDEFDYGIAHTRWATHWEVNLTNTHPHFSENYILVHNWIIENYHQLKSFLIDKGIKFYSDTDTEVVAKLLEYYDNGNFLETVEKVLEKLEGAYAFLIINKKYPGEMIGVRYGSPLIFGFNEKEMFFASDINALWWFAKDIIYLDDGDVVYLNNNDFVIRSFGKLVSKPMQKIDVENIEEDKWNFPHYMLKEIFEQPDVIRRVLQGRIDWNNYNIVSDSLKKLDNLNINKICIIWCWTSYYAWMVGKYFLQQLADIHVDVHIASEFINEKIFVSDDTLFVFISQSWETADTIEALNLVKEKGGKTFGIVNVVWSTISRLTDYGMFTRAWVEIWVASTKAFMSQIATLLLMALYLGKKRNLDYKIYKTILEEVKLIPNKIQSILDESDKIKDIASQLLNYKNFFFLGRFLQYPIALESSLKFKEITYLHSEAYPAWELKHWPLALIDSKFPVVIFAPNDNLLKDNISSINEIKTRKGKVLAISDVYDVKNLSDWFIYIPSTNYVLYPFLTVVVWQLLAYFMANMLGREIDKPRNLAKSVTVK